MTREQENAPEADPITGHPSTMLRGPPPAWSAARISVWLPGAARDDHRLPARVRVDLQRQQEASEILIGWVLLGVVTAFTILYALSPKTFPDDVDFVPVPWVLGAYFLFAVIRLGLAYRGKLRQWLLTASVVLDMALLFVLIWSFHLQYEQPPSFYLKAPTLLYVFIFITLHGLRFDARYVVLAGLAAAGGWLAMVLYAIGPDSENPTITRDYVEYITSNKVLLGAEFDKVISILVVTVILAVAINRARALLIRSVVEANAARGLSKFVPSEVVRQITESDEDLAAGYGEVREATILFTDIENFTSLGEKLSPRELIAVLNEYFAAVAEPIERHGGVINQFQGDAILATFNLPLKNPDHAANAVSAATAIQALLAERTFGDGISLRTRVGINTGTVLGGLVGTGDRLGYTVHGDDVNLAARLESLNKDHGTRVIVAENTRERAGKDRFPFMSLGTVQVRGKRAPVTIYALGSGPGNGDMSP